MPKELFFADSMFGDQISAFQKLSRRYAHDLVKYPGKMIRGFPAAYISKDMAYVSRITRFTLLSPEIIHGILTGQLWRKLFQP